MKILHTVSGIWKHSGGPAEVIPLLCRHLQLAGNSVSIVAIAGDISNAALHCRKDGVSLHTVPVLFKRWPWYGYGIKATIRRLVQDADIVHGNGMWEYVNWCTGSEIMREHKPYVVSFHGSIMHTQTRWRLRHNIAWKLIDGRYIKQAACLHACTVEELESIRKAGLSNPVAVIPNGIETWSWLPDRIVTELVPEFAGKKSLLFLSRIHPDKGVYDLVIAWCSLKNVSDQWQLVIAGPGASKHIAELYRLIKSKCNNRQVIYLGPLFAEKRMAAYQACDVFVCPSKTENFALVVGEALANGKPVIATHAVPWPELVQNGCGWWVPNTVVALQSAIKEAMSITDDQRREMGQRGKDMVLSNYAWPIIANKMQKTYEWILGGGQIPSWVDIT